MLIQCERQTVLQAKIFISSHQRASTGADQTRDIGILYNCIALEVDDAFFIHSELNIKLPHVFCSLNMRHEATIHGE